MANVRSGGAEGTGRGDALLHDWDRFADGSYIYLSLRPVYPNSRFRAHASNSARLLKDPCVLYLHPRRTGNAIC